MKDEPGNPKDQLDLFILEAPAELIQMHERFLHGDRLTFAFKEISKGSIQAIRNAFEGLD